MKGVILGVHPRCRIVDVTHDVPPQDVREAAYVLRGARSYFPPGTVFLCVVDPGVGGRRMPIAAEADGQLFVAPDNGLLSLVGPFDLVVELSDESFFRQPVSHTFHGRDIFAPVAAHLASGSPLSEVGGRIDEIEHLSFPTPVRVRGEVRGEVIRVDRFGNLVTNLRPGDLPSGGSLVVRVGRRRVEGLSRSYEQVPVGRALAIVGSDGTVEVSIRDGSAADVLRAGVGDRVVASATPTPR